MSVLVGSHVGKGGGIGWARYCLRLDLGEEARREAVPVVISDLGDDHYEIGMNAELLIEGATRKNLGESLVLSFPAYEMDKGSAVDQQRVADLAYELTKRTAPTVPVVVAVHTDSEGGMLHAHILAVNHDLETGRSNQARMDIKHLRRINDALMREEGLEVCNQNDKSKGRTWQEVMQDRKDTERATDELLEANPDAVPKTPRLTIEDVIEKPTRQTSRAFFRQEIDEAVVDAATKSVPEGSPDVSLETLRDALSERGIEMRILPDRGHGETITFGAVDDDGMPVTVTRKSKSKKAPEKTSPVAAKGSQLGAAYSPDALQERMQEVVRMQRLHAYLRDGIDELVETAADRMADVEYPGGASVYVREAVQAGGAGVWLEADEDGHGLAWDGRQDSTLRTDAAGEVTRVSTDDLGEAYAMDRLTERVTGRATEIRATRAVETPTPATQTQTPSASVDGSRRPTAGEKVKRQERAFLKQRESSKTDDRDTEYPL